jgi:DNA-directed RNA polymerase subunit RPC12/RpoP
MTPSAAGLKAQMMAEAEEVIDNLLAGVGAKQDVMLSDIEQLVRVAGQRVMECFTQALVEAEAEVEGIVTCPDCGQRMRYKGRKARDLVTETGEVSLQRGYYYCPGCQQGLFPPRPTVEAE